MPKGPLHGDDATAGRDQARGVEAPEVVQSKPGDAGGADGGGAPAIADGVLVRGLSGVSCDEPSTSWGERGDMRRHVELPQDKEADPLAAVLGRPQLDPALAASLYLPGGGDPASQEVDVLDLGGGGLAEP